MLRVKKAAMFGLDARIALAIFGALSVISGAALYSAIQNAKVVQQVTFIKELEKAWEAYYLDTGADLKLYGDYRNTYNLAVNENIKGWDGPYIALDTQYTSGAASLLINPFITANKIHMLNANSQPTWGGDTSLTSWDNEGICTAGDCYIWIPLRVSSLAIADAIDKYVDGTNDRFNGRIKVTINTSNDTAAVWYKMISTSAI
jgi:type II secretory pathway pseudopilin PulG